MERFHLVGEYKSIPVDTERPQVVIPRPASLATEVDRSPAVWSFQKLRAATLGAAEVWVGFGLKLGLLRYPAETASEFLDCRIVVPEESCLSSASIVVRSSAMCNAASTMSRNLSCVTGSFF